MLQKSFLLILSSILLISGCSTLTPEPKVVTVTKTVTQQLQKTTRPKPVSLNNISIRVVTAENFDQFKQDVEKTTGNFVFYAITVQDYESLAYNLAEIRRYLLQQKQVIIYYETMVDNNNKK